jgi:hypothetical protein
MLSKLRTHASKRHYTVESQMSSSSKYDTQKSFLFDFPLLGTARIFAPNRELATSILFHVFQDLELGLEIPANGGLVQFVCVTGFRSGMNAPLLLEGDDEQDC